MGEELVEVGEGFELKRVSSRVKKKHGGLFAHLAFEASGWLNDELHAEAANALCELLPLLQCEDNAEVRNGHVVAID